MISLCLQSEKTNKQKTPNSQKKSDSWLAEVRVRGGETGGGDPKVQASGCKEVSTREVMYSMMTTVITAVRCM